VVKRKSRAEVGVADGAGGMMKMQDRRFEAGKWPISFDIPVAQEQASRWSRYLQWECHKRGWGSAAFGQIERVDNSGTITITTNGKPHLDIVWERKRDRPLNVRARLATSSDLSLSDAEQFFSQINNCCHSAASIPIYCRGTLQYDGLPWCGELWLDDKMRLAPPSLQDDTALNGPRIVHVDAVLECVGEPDVGYVRHRVLQELSLFLSVVMGRAVRLPDHGRVWTFMPDGKGSEVRSLGYLEVSNPLTMPVLGTIQKVPLRAPDDMLVWDAREISVRKDIADLWRSYRSLNVEQRLQFLQAAAKWQEALIHWQDRPSLSFALMAVSCEALKPTDADQRRNCYDVIEALLGKPAVDRIRQNPFPTQHVRGTHLHSGELHGPELMMMEFMPTYRDPSFEDAHREMTRVTPAAIIEWLKRQAMFTLPPVETRPTLRRWALDHLVALLGITLALGLAVGWVVRTVW
jgi:hypothetical protein